MRRTRVDMNLVRYADLAEGAIERGVPLRRDARIRAAEDRQHWRGDAAQLICGHGAPAIERGDRANLRRGGREQQRQAAAHTETDRANLLRRDIAAPGQVI